MNNFLIIIFLSLIFSVSAAQTTYERRKISSNVKHIVHELADKRTISGALVGRAPEKPKQYEVFEKLKAHANEKELFELTNHPNPTIRGYAFWGLMEVNFSKAQDVIIKNQNDTVLIDFNYGCTTKEKRLIMLMTQLMLSHAAEHGIELNPEVNAIAQREKELWFAPRRKRFAHMNAVLDSINDIAVLNKEVRKITREKIIVYVDRVNSNHHLVTQLQNEIAKGSFSNRTGDTLTLTDEEQDYLLLQTELPTTWNENLLPDSRRIPVDSMWNYLEQKRKDRKDAANAALLNKDIEAINRIQNELNYVFTFTKPVYFRNNSICLISFDAICGNICGQSEVSFYRKENNEWLKWIIVAAGDY